MVKKPIHETIVRDIIDLAQDLKDYDEVEAFTGRTQGRSFGSITSKAKGLVMVFPVICSNYMSYDSAMLVAKATERKAATLLSMLFQAANICDVNDVEEYISRFHTNLRTGRMSMDDFHNMLDGFVEENGLIPHDSIAHEQYNSIMNDLTSMNCYFESNLSEYSVDDYKYIATSSGNMLIGTPVTEAIFSGNRMSPDSIDNRASGTMKNISDIYKADHDIAKNTILDSEVKKANELAPTLLYVNFVSTREDGYAVAASGIVGVKAKLYVCDGEDIMNRFEIKHSDKNLMLNLIKVSSREISFFRDFIFAIDRAKIDAMSQSRRGSSSHLWKILERRAIKSKIRRALSMTNDATAITTVCITKDEVEYLKKTRYIDVENPRIITKIMDSYNMMGFVIVDESLEIAKFLYDDGEGVFETITFTGLEREQKDNTKKIVNLMSKMSR